MFGRKRQSIGAQEVDAGADQPGNSCQVTELAFALVDLADRQFPHPLSAMPLTESPNTRTLTSLRRTRYCRVSLVPGQGHDLTFENAVTDDRVDQHEWKDEKTLAPEHECKT